MVLFVGVAIVQVQNASAAEAKESQSAILGFGSVVVACLFSGFAGVYFEKVLKFRVSKFEKKVKKRFLNKKFSRK